MKTTATTKFWKIHNEADEPAELLLYGEISDQTWYGDEVTPKQFAEDLQALQGKDLTVRVNSPGGDVFAAQAIYNQLKLYGGHVTMRIDGLAASAATIITCAGDTVIMPSNALFMIHNPKGALMGFYESGELNKYASALDTIKQSIVNVYSQRTNGVLSEVQLKHKMDAETWMTADEAKAYGFVDEVDADMNVENSLHDGVLVMNSVACNLSRFEHGDSAVNIISGFKKPKIKESEDEIMSNNELLDKIKNLLGVGNEGPNEPAIAKAETEQPDPAKVERERLLALDALDKHDNPAVTKLINAAKENGSTAEQVKPFIDAVQEDNEQKTEQMQVLDAIRALIKDEMNSGAAAVAPSVPQDKADEKKAAIDQIVAFANGQKG